MCIVCIIGHQSTIALVVIPTANKYNYDVIVLIGINLRESGQVTFKLCFNLNTNSIQQMYLNNLFFAYVNVGYSNLNFKLN